MIYISYVKSHHCLFFLVDTEYNSDLSCHYKVELSYENLVTSGPDPHPPPIADDETDDEDDDDVPRVNEAPTTTMYLNNVVLLCIYVNIYFVLERRRITMPFSSRPGRPKCSPPFAGGSVTKLRGNLAWTKSKERCSWVKSCAPKHFSPFCLHHLTKTGINIQQFHDHKNGVKAFLNLNLIMNTIQSDSGLQ